MRILKDLRVRLYADGADLKSIIELSLNPLIRGFTTNPTLMRKAGVPDYIAFAEAAITTVSPKPISLEVFSGDFVDMERQALRLATLGSNVFVKIPITNPRGESSAKLIERLASDGVQLNITAILTLEQVKIAAVALSNAPAIISVFAGRIADTGVDPEPLMREAKTVLGKGSPYRLLWASCREMLNIFQANRVGADVITVPPDILKKLPMIGMDLTDLSLETVQMFDRDAAAVGYQV
jgi:transaldolase